MAYARTAIAPSVTRTPGNFTLSVIGTDSGQMEEEVLGGLMQTPKVVPPKYLYDGVGSTLFDRICELPEYYLTRAEMAVLTRHGAEILERLGQNLCVVEPGAGACQKAQLLLGTGRVATFVPVDISAGYLEQTALTVAGVFPRVSVHAVAADFLTGLPYVEAELPSVGTRLIFYPGSSIGNFDRPDALRLLRQFCALLREGDGLIIGYDLRKDPAVLRRAYDDSAGITARFNLNLLARMNRDLGADFNLDAFRHVALYNRDRGRIEMHLESLHAQQVKIADRVIGFDRSERIHTESSYKYTVRGFDDLCREAGFEPVDVWTDRASSFAVALYTKTTG